jgi:cytochrome c5
MGRWLPILAVALLGCADEEDTDTLCDREVPLTYEGFGMSFMDTHCNGCHSSLIAPAQRRGAPESVNLDTYGDVLAWAERIEERVVLNAEIEGASRMPPGGGPTREELDMLHEWLQCGVYPDKAQIDGDGEAG